MSPATSATVIAAAMVIFGAATAFAANPGPNPAAGPFLLIGIAVGRRRTARSAA